MEEIIGSKGSAALPYALKDRFDLDGVEKRVVNSTVYLELENKHGQTITLKRAIKSETIDSTGLSLNGTNQCAVYADHVSFLPGAENFCLELKFDCSTIAASANKRIFNWSVDTTGLGIVVIQNTADLVIYVSTTGTSWTYQDTVHTLVASTDTDFKLERQGAHLVYYVDGTEVLRNYIAPGTSIHDANTNIELGSKDSSADWFAGHIISCRWTIGAYRYGHEHDAYNTTDATSFSDNGELLEGGYEYSDNPVWCLSDLATDPVIGLGLTSTSAYRKGIRAAAGYCD
jgi:hypothetical protein